MPEPVGATTSACRPAPIASHAPTWAGVGSANAAPNQVRVGSLNRASGIGHRTILAHGTDDACSPTQQAAGFRRVEVGAAVTDADLESELVGS